tara:strand:+ start:1051 stop:2712 length:1662 start_codon:yes stop_codon:yes gene_type:complete
MVKDFKNFLYMAWKHLNLPDPTPVQYDIAEYLQNKTQRREVIEAFRGVGKSWITSAYVCHQLYLNPQMNILVVSASKTRADDFSTFTLRLIHEMPLLAHLKPKDGQRMSKISFDVAPAQASHAPSVKSLGITGQLTGSRADLIIADDVESANNSMTQMMRDKLAETIKEFEAIVKPGGRIVFLGTPQTEMSIYNLLDERGYKTRIWTARYPDDRLKVAMGQKLAPFIADKEESESKPTDPLRFDDNDLLEREASYGKSGFALQFMLDVSMSDANKYPLKINDIMVMSGCYSWTEAPVKVQWASGREQLDGCKHLPNIALKGDYWCNPMTISPENAAWDGAVMSIDPSGRGKDETAYAVVKMLKGQLYLTASGGISNGYQDASLEVLTKIAKEQNVNKIIVESNFGDGMFTQLLKPVLTKVHPVSIEEVRHNIQKEKRIIDTLEPILNQHRLVVDQKVILDDYNSETELKYKLFYQLTRLTRERGALIHDDRLDALSIAVAYWIETLDRDINQAVNDHRQELLDIELDKFLETAIGKKTNSDNWTNLYNTSDRP